MVLHVSPTLPKLLVTLVKIIVTMSSLLTMSMMSCGIPATMTMQRDKRSWGWRERDERWLQLEEKMRQGSPVRLPGETKLCGI
jgi:hypothetical protein